MNKLHDLYEECGVYIDPHNYAETRKEIDFYAEQIVKECIKVVESYKYKMDASNDNIVVALKTEFGIE